jgi:SET domain-containing protein
VITDLVVRNIPGRGRGIIATRNIPANTLIEVSPVIVLPESDVNGVLDHYVYRWLPGYCAVAFGFGSLFNHSRKPNIEADMRIPKCQIEFRTLRNIAKGVELRHDYEYDPPGYDGQ